MCCFSSRLIIALAETVSYIHLLAVSPSASCSRPKQANCHKRTMHWKCFPHFSAAITSAIGLFCANAIVLNIRGQLSRHLVNSVELIWHYVFESNKKENDGLYSIIESNEVSCSVKRPHWACRQQQCFPRRKRRPEVDACGLSSCCYNVLLLGRRQIARVTVKLIFVCAGSASRICHHVCLHSEFAAESTNSNINVLGYRDKRTT